MLFIILNTCLCWTGGRLLICQLYGAWKWSSLLGPSTEECSKLTQIRSMLRKKTLGYSFFQDFSLEKPVQLTTVVWLLHSFSLFQQNVDLCCSVVFKLKSWIKSFLLNYPVSWTSTLATKVGSMVVNRTACLSCFHLDRVRVWTVAAFGGSTLIQNRTDWCKRLWVNVWKIKNATICTR